MFSAGMQSKKNFEFEASRIADALTEKKELEATLWPSSLDYLEECATEAFGLTDLYVPAMMAIRNELNLPIDESAYKNIVETSILKETEELKLLLSELRNFMNPDTVTGTSEPGAG